MPDITPKKYEKENPYWSEITEEDLDKYDIHENNRGTIVFFKIGTEVCHREENLPAIITLNGYQECRINNQLHSLTDSASSTVEIYSLFGKVFPPPIWGQKKMAFLNLKMLKEKLKE